jgi:MFS family permease
MAALAILGACQVLYYATTNTLIQVLVPPRLRGRVISIYILASWGTIPFGNLAAGAVAEQFGATVALAGGGLLTLLVVITVVLAYPPIRRLRSEGARVREAAGETSASPEAAGDEPARA